MNAERPTIAFLVDNLDEFQNKYIYGAMESAEKNGFNLITLCGGAYKSSDPYVRSLNISYDLVHQNNVDGIIVLTPFIGHFLDQANIQLFFKRFEGIPIISISMKVENYPAVMIDNSNGFKELICHLIDYHHYTDFAYISGPLNNMDAMIRYKIFRETLAERKITFNEDLFYEGDFSSDSGRKAVKEFLKLRAPIRCLVSANDQMAYGVLKELEKTGIKVPEEIAVTGFDNEDLSSCTEPLLTTVEQPFSKQGRIAADLVYQIVQGNKKVPDFVVPLKLVLRESCGCSVGFSRMDIKAYKPMEEETEALPLVFHRVQNDILNDLSLKFSPQFEDKGVSFDDTTRFIFDSLVTAAGIEDQQTLIKHFRRVLKKIFPGEITFVWTDVLEELYHLTFYYSGFKDSNRKFRTDLDLLQMMIAKRSYLNEKYLIKNFLRVNLLNLLIMRDKLISAESINEIFNTLGNALPGMGVHTFLLSLCNGPLERVDEEVTLSLGLFEGKVLTSKDNIHYPLNELVPPQLSMCNKQFSLLMEPIMIDFKAIGFLLHEFNAEVEIFDREIRSLLSAVLRYRLLYNESLEKSRLLLISNEKLKDHEREINFDLIQAASVQKTILTSKSIYLLIEGVELDVQYIPMSDSISGDYYNIAPLKNGIATIMIADTTGHGVQAGLSTMQLDIFNRDSLKIKYPDERYEYINEAIINQFVSRNFFTAFIINIYEDKIYYSSAAHPAQYLLRQRTKEVIPLKTKGKILGMIKDCGFEMKEEPIEKGDRIFLFTDGILEEINGEEEEFGEVRIINWLKENAFQKRPEEINLAIIEKLKMYNLNRVFHDDITLVSVLIK